jgi:hypothetical protein
MKRKFSSHAEVCHVWAQQNQPYGEASNIYFDGAIVYSYGNHYPLGVIAKNDKGGELALLNNTSYSVSTCKHQSHAWRATMHYTQVYLPTEVLKCFEYKHMTHFKRDLKKTIQQYLLETITTQAKSAAKRRKAELLHDDINEACKAYDQAKTVLEFYGLKMPAIVARRIEELQNDHESVIAKHAADIKRENAKRAKAEKKRQAELEEAAKDAIEAFKRGDKLNYEQTNALFKVKKVYMRPESDGNIYTTKGAIFPIEHGKKAFKFIRLARENKAQWIRNGKSIHLGHYAVDKIAANGDVTAGCHFIEWQEVERVARQLEIYP